ncbi:unnamed protein product [Rhizoctonia solani]|uniref:Uncharacterized protein n=1 Tax=Rhizoctonia solani TaxID=456999 RepID=A0A8H3E108_9AGAM|nr:unnamed protein product [Rhizoctonia solani]CAE7148749.1 unnamed protein product [Rhizoctonia solani]
MNSFTQESSESKLVSVLTFQEHIIGRIGVHAKTVESAGLGSVETIAAELYSTLSRVWESIREDYTSEAMCNIGSLSRICTRLYEAYGDSDYKSQLDIWSDSVGLAHIRFVTDLTDYRDEQGHQLFQAFPLFPFLKFMGQNYIARGQSEQEAYQKSSSRIPLAQLDLRPESITYHFDYRGDGSVIAKPFFVGYGDCVQLINGEVVGWGTSRASAEEMAAGRLLCSGRYCYYN